MKRSQFLRRLLGAGIAVVPAAKVIGQLATIPKIEKELPAIVDKTIESPASFRTGMPYIIDVNNWNGNSVRNVDMFGAYKYLPEHGIYNKKVQGVSFSNPNKLINQFGVDVSADPSCGSYRDVLHSSMVSPFTCGLMYVMCENVKQFTEPIQIISTDGNGNTAIKVCHFLHSPYNVVDTIMNMRVSFMVDGFTSVRIPKLHANTKMKFWFYPEENINLQRSLRTTVSASSVQKFDSKGAIKSLSKK